MNYLIENGIFSGSVGVSKFCCPLCAYYPSYLQQSQIASFTLSGEHNTVYQQWAAPNRAGWDFVDHLTRDLLIAFSQAMSRPPSAAILSNSF